MKQKIIKQPILDKIERLIKEGYEVNNHSDGGFSIGWVNVSHFNGDYRLCIMGCDIEVNGVEGIYKLLKENYKFIKNNE